MFITQNEQQVLHTCKHYLDSSIYSLRLDPTLTISISLHKQKRVKWRCVHTRYYPYSGGGPPFLQKITIKTKTKTSIYLHFFPFTIDHFPNSIQTCVTSHHKTGTYIYDLLIMEVATYCWLLNASAILFWWFH